MLVFTELTRIESVVLTNGMFENPNHRIIIRKMQEVN